MIEVWGLVLLRPGWLVALPLALGAAWLAARRADGLARWRGVIDPALLPALGRLGVIEPAEQVMRPWLLGAGGALLALGLAGPATRNEDVPAFRNLDAILILMDLSPSVAETDALGAARTAVAGLLDRHATRPVALLVYAGESFLVSVPSEETAAVESLVAVVDAGTMPLAGSRPDRALSMARTTLGDAAAERADVVLVTDGAGLGAEALHEARRLRAEGARVSGVFVAPVESAYGAVPPDRAALAALAEAGGGLVVDGDATEPLEALLAERGGVTASEARRQALVFIDHGRWLTLPALACLATLFRRRRRA